MATLKIWQSITTHSGRAAVEIYDMIRAGGGDLGKGSAWILAILKCEWEIGEMATR